MNRLVRKYSTAFPQQVHSPLQLPPIITKHSEQTELNHVLSSTSRLTDSSIGLIPAKTIEIPHFKSDQLAVSVSICASAADIDAWLHQHNIRSEKAIGIDVEWKPMLAPGQPRNKIALIQLATTTHVALIQALAVDRFPDSFRECLRSKSLLKVGVNIINDLKFLKQDYGLEYNGAVDLRKSHIVDLFTFIFCVYL